MNALPSVLHQTRVFLADADLVPTALEGWGELLALVLLVMTILYAVYIAARQEWQMAQGSKLRSDARVNRGPDFKGQAAA
ncbi:hypothetical protein AYO41_03195 [Verrucomicrobia bacterium SCGC AG-212-E04]|nr:hypothetical protein AYO41_03195 [Verrucomicrobia bacterium SCGC AG-212-E04]